MQKNDIGYHLPTEAIAILRGRVSSFLVLRLNPEKELLQDLVDVTVRSTTAGWLLRLLLSLSR